MEAGPRGSGGGGRKRGVNHGQSRSVTVVDYSLLNCTSLTVNGAVTEIQSGNPAGLSAGSYRLTYAQALIKLDAFP